MNKFFCIFFILLFISKTENVFSSNLIYDVNNVEVNGKINNNFNNNKLIDSGFKKAFIIFIDKTLKNVKKNFLRKLLNFVPFKVKQIIKFFKKWYYFKTYKYRSPVNEKILSEEINTLELEGVLVNHKELNKISSILTDSNNND